MAFTTPSAPAAASPAAKPPLIKRPRSSAQTFAAKTGDQDAGYCKVAVVGGTGTGKTRTILGLLEAGERVLVLTTDFGGSGLATVTLELRRDGQERAELLKNLAEIELENYQQVADFLESPEVVTVNGVPLWDWDPTFLVWDGASNFQLNMLQEYILAMAPGTKGSSEARLNGLRSEQQDWDAIKRGTFAVFSKFLKMHNPQSGRKIHKLVTFYEKTPEENVYTGEIKRMPMIQGASKFFTVGGFNVILYTRREAKPGADGVVYQYLTNSAKHETKVRGLKLNDVEPADFCKLWQEIKRQSGY